jgi:PadR family transcriptional regulator, regulatory protein AphA
MDLRSAILGLLSWKPSSGYDLKRIISDSDIFYWSGNNNQIYKSLVELQQESLVTYQVQLQESLPAKKVYTITDQGLSALHQSLLEAPETPELHKSFLIQLAWAEILSDEEILALLEKYTEEIAVRLRMYQAQAVRPASRPDRSKREQYLWKRIEENLIAACQAELDWVLQTQQEFRERKFAG